MFNEEKTTQVVISRKHHQRIPHFSWTAINWTFHLLSLNLVFLFHLISLGNPILTPLQSMYLRNCFLSRARGYFSLSQLLTIYKSQIRPSLKYCSNVWGGAPKSSLHFLDRVQSKAICLINNPNLTNSLQSLSHRCLVADLSIFYCSRTLLSGNQEYYS